jgi:ribosomal protein L24E
MCVIHDGKIFVTCTGKIFVSCTGKIFVSCTGKIFVSCTGKIFVSCTGKIFVSCTGKTIMCDTSSVDATFTWMKSSHYSKRGHRIFEPGLRRVRGHPLRSVIFQRNHEFGYFGSAPERPLLCAAKDETSVEFMRPLLNSWAECSVVISC